MQYEYKSKEQSHLRFCSSWNKEEYDAPKYMKNMKCKYNRKYIYWNVTNILLNQSICLATIAKITKKRTTNNYVIGLEITSKM